MVRLNCLAKNIQNAKDIIKVCKGHAWIGLMSTTFDTDEDAIKQINKWAKQLDNKISIGLGNGSAKQAYMITRLAQKVNVAHANQVFSEVAATRAVAKNKNLSINGLVNPSGNPGSVIISTGPLSINSKIKAEVDVETAILMIKEMGGNALKYFNMKNMVSIDEFVQVAKACAKYDFILEMTGGLSPKNLEKYVKIAKEQNVKQIMPHIYTSIIDNQTGLTKIEDVQKIWKILKTYY